MKCGWSLLFSFVEKKKGTVLLLPTLLIAIEQVSFSQVLQKNFYSTDGFVNAIAVSGDTVFIGGTFAYVGPSTGNAANIDASTGTVNTNFPAASGGDVYAVAPDNSGGWYLGGAFTHVGGISRKNFAHVNPDMSVDTNWTLYPDDAVYAILVSGSTVYLGGAFKNIILTSTSHSSRRNLAALDASRDTLLSWNPRGNNTVLSLALSGSTMYAGGMFTTIGGAAGTDTLPRNYIAAIDTLTGVATSWTPNANGAVNAIAISGSTLYAGGSFDTIGVGDSLRNHIAALDTSMGIATAWNPNTDAAVNTIVVPPSGGFIYAGGNFATVGGTSRSRIAAIDTATGLVTSWNPNAAGRVNSIVLSGSSLYVGGVFTHIGGAFRNHLAEVDTITGIASTWNPNNPDNLDSVLTLGVYGSAVVAGGEFITVGPVVRNNLAALSVSTGAVLDWNPNADGGVNAMVLSGRTLYVGGSFGSIGSTSCSFVAEVNISTGNATAFNASPNNTVQALCLSAPTLFVGGNFTKIGVNSVKYLTSFNTSSGFTGWSPNPNNNVYAIAVGGSTVYAGGVFTTVGGNTRNYIAAMTKSTGSTTSWNPNANQPVQSLVFSGSTLYAAGQFTIIGDSSRKRIAALDTSTGLATSWNPSANNEVDALAISSSQTLYAGGLFTSIGNAARNYIAALDISTGLSTSWNPNADAAVQSIALDYTNQQVYLGGSFATMLGGANQTFAGVTNPYDVSLPLELSSFTASSFGVEVTLQWSTATEVQNAGFEVQRSSAGENGPAQSWEKVGYVAGAGTSFIPKNYSFTDGHTLAGKYEYRLRQIDRNGAFSYSQTVQVNVAGAPGVFELRQNYPNPFNPTTNIQFTVPEDGRATLRIYNILGQVVTTLFDGNAAAGVNHQALFDASRLSSGVYFARLQYNGSTLLKKMLLLK
ncbi:MAG: T9SS type A sorting domain-containing protein [Bacteroidota bacterium]